MVINFVFVNTNYFFFFHNVRVQKLYNLVPFQILVSANDSFFSVSVILVSGKHGFKATVSFR